MKNFTIIIFLLANINLFAQTTYVPDDNFEQALIDLRYDDVLDDYVLTANISGIDSLNVSNKNISDLTGIEDFISLTYLNCFSNQLTSLDVSNNTDLNILACNSNQLTSLNVSQNTALTYLYCHYNQLTSLDVSQNTSLYLLYCRQNSIANLDVSNNTDLNILDCNSNQLTSLNVSQNTALTYLYCYNNQLTSLDVSQNIDLNTLICSSNQLVSINISQNPVLTYLYCQENQLTVLDISQNPDLQCLYCDENQITSLDVSNNTDLNILDCNSNLLTNLKVRNGNNVNFTAFDATNNPNLTCIFVDDAAWSQANWTNIDATSTFVETEAECDAISSDVENIDKANLYIFPNPAKDNFSIKTDNQIESIKIYDVFGKLVKEFREQNNYPVSNLANAVYTLKIKTDKGVFTKKLIINN